MSYTTFIQWKGTDLCMDFNCPGCGDHSHYDGMFIYAVKCVSCGKVYKLPDEVGSLLKEIGPEDDCYEGAAIDIHEQEQPETQKVKHGEGT